MKKNPMIVLMIFICIAAFPQKNVPRHVKENENLIFSFRLKNSEKIVTIIETAEKQIVYRFGKPGNIELEYPAQKVISPKVFTLRWYIRPSLGGSNEGMIQLRLDFVNEGYKYVVYYDFYAADNSVRTGIEIFTSQGQKAADLTGNEVEGSLMNLMDDERVNTIEIPGGE